MSSSKPLHIRIGMWHTQLAEKGEAIPILDSDCKYVFMPRQKLLKAIDPTGTRLLDDVRDEIADMAEKFQAVISEDDRMYTEMTLCDMLDIYEFFYVLNYREPQRSAVDICCGCATCLQWTVCGHNTLLANCFDPKLSVPTKWEQSSPSLRLARGRRGLPGVSKGRGIAGAKRLRFEKVIAQEKQSGVKTARRIKVIGPFAKVHATLTPPPCTPPPPPHALTPGSAGWGRRKSRRGREPIEVRSRRPA